MLVVRLVGGHPSNEILLEDEKEDGNTLRIGLIEHVEGENLGARSGTRRPEGNRSFGKRPESGEAHAYHAVVNPAPIFRAHFCHQRL